MEHDWTVRIGGRQFGVEQARDAYSSRRWTTIHWGGAQTTLKVRAALFIGLGLLSVPAVGALALSAPRELRRE